MDIFLGYDLGRRQVSRRLRAKFGNPMPPAKSSAIPMPVIALTAELFDAHYTRTQFEKIFGASGTSVESPTGNKVQTVKDWLKAINRHEAGQSLRIFGKILEDFFEGLPLDPHGTLESDRQKLRNKLAQCGLRYVDGGTISPILSGGATQTVAFLIHDKNFPAVVEEFERATNNVQDEPREAASAAANILEAICKEYIVQHPHLIMPAKQDLSAVFDVVRRDLGFDPSAIEDTDLRQILSGLFAIVNGVAALRTHASSAHAQATSMRRYRLSPRHARLAVNAAHALVAFIVETWQERDVTAGT